MSIFSKKKKKEVAVETVVETVEKNPAEPKKFEGVEPEVVAAITAAVYAMMGTTSNLVVRNIVRVNDSTPIWAKVSRRDVMSGRL